MSLFLKSKSLWALLLTLCLLLGAAGCNPDKKANARYTTATNAFQQGDFAKALQLFQEINKKYPKYSNKNNVDYHIILCQNKLGQNDAALKGIDMLLNKPGLPQAMQGDLMVNRGNIYFNQKNYSEALNNYDQALNRFGSAIPGSDAVYARAGECCEALGQTDRAWTYWEKIPSTSVHSKGQKPSQAPVEPPVVFEDTPIKDKGKVKGKTKGKGKGKGTKGKGKGKGKGKASSKSGSWIVQCGFFKDTKSTEKLVNKLKKAGFKAKYKKSGKGYLVYLGPTSKAEAQRLAPQCDKAGATGAFAAKQ